MTTKHVGGCLCEAIRFEAVGDPVSVSHCHCFFCRRQTGAAFATFASFGRPDRFRWLSGKPAVYRSSPSVRRHFCRRCGTPLTFEEDGRPHDIDIAISAFDEPDRMPSGSHHHVNQKISWLDIADGLPQFGGDGEVQASTRRE